MKELKVDIFPLIKKLEIALKKGFSHEMMTGSYLSAYKGRGMEFVGFREYTPHDDALMIDWKASLRTHKPMVRMLEEERDLTIFFLMDVSESMLFSSHSKLKCEYAIEFVAAMSFAISAAGDRVGMALFSDRVNEAIKPNHGKTHFYTILKTLLDPSHYGGKYDLGYALHYLLTLSFLPRDSIIFVLSDFIGMQDGWQKDLKICGMKYDFTAIIVRDPVDMRLPDIATNIRLKDPFSGEQILIDNKKAREEYARESMSQITRLRKELRKTHSDDILLLTNHEFIEEIFKFFMIRKKKKK